MNKKKDIFQSLDNVFVGSKMSEINQELLDGLEDHLMRLARACNIPEEEIENIYKESPEEQEEKKKTRRKRCFLYKSFRTTNADRCFP